MKIRAHPSTALHLAALTALSVALLLAPQVAHAVPIMADSCPMPVLGGGSTAFAPGGGEGQSFTAIEGTLDSVVLTLYDYGADSGAAWVEIYSHAGVWGTSGTPTGAPLATSASVGFDTIVGEDALTAFRFDNSVELTQGTRYFLVLRHDGASLLAALADNGPAHPGNAAHDWGAGWAPYSSDMVFSVYQTPVAAPPPETVSTPASSDWSLALAVIGALGVTLSWRRRVANS